MLYIALIALVASTFGACTNEFEPGPQMPGPQVSFLSSNPTQVEFTGAANENTQKLTLTRIEKEEELTVDLLIEVDSKYSTIFSIPETVTFAAGEATTELVYTVDQSKLSSDVDYSVNFLIADEMMSTPYGYTEWKVNYALNPWEIVKDSKGNNAKGKFRGLAVVDYVWNIDTTLETEVDIYEHKSKPGVYKIANPWTATFAFGFGYSTIEDAISAGMVTTNADFIIDASNPNAVVFEEQSMGIDIGYGDMSIMSGYPLYVADPASGAGTLADGIITFPAGTGILFYSPGINIANGLGANSLLYANTSEMFRIVMPGVEVADYSLAVEYNGMDVTADDVATAKFKFTYGDNVTGIKYMIVKGNVENNPLEALATLFAGTDENILTVEDFVKGGKTANVRVGLESDTTYTIVAAPADKNNELRSKEVFVKSFYFRGIGAVQEHPCEVNATLDKYSAFWDDNMEPDYGTLGVHIKGSDLKEVYLALFPTATVEKYMDQDGWTMLELFEAAGVTPFNAESLALVNSEEGAKDYYPNLTPDTSYTLLVYATNNYDKKKEIRLEKKTEPAPAYTGELVLGDYLMSCTINAGTEDEYTSNNLFNVTNVPESNDQFLVKSFAMEDGYKWCATYDSTASTLTLDGNIFGYDVGPMFGIMYGDYNSDGTQVYGIFSFATATSEEGNDPVVLKVDPTTKQICGLPTGASVWVYVGQPTSDGVKLLGSARVFDDTTVIAPYVPSDSGASTNSIMSVGTPSVQTLMNNIKMASLSKKLQSIKAANVVKATNASKSGIKTVKPSLVESYTPEKSTSFKLKTNIKAFAR